MNKTKMDRLIKAAQICSEALIRVGVVCGVLAQTLAELTDELSEPSAPESAAQPVSEKSEEIKANVGFGDPNPEDLDGVIGQLLRRQQ